MDGVALAAVLSSAVVGAGGLTVTVWSNRRAERREDQLRRQDRLADSYISVLDLAEREGYWVRAHGELLEWLTTEPFIERPASVERPTQGERSSVEARLLGFGSRNVIAAYRTWKGAIGDLMGERVIIEWNVSQEGRDPGRPLDRAYIVDYLELLEAQEQARERLINAVSKDLRSS